MARQAYTDERGSVHGVNPGTELGRYTVETRIEEIPGGERWNARDTTLDRDVTLIVMPADADSTAAALDAARRAAGIEAAQLVRILDVGSEAEHSFVAEDAIGDASTYTEVIGTEGLPAEEVRRITGEVATGIEAARARGLHHLALTPDLVLLTGDGRVKVRGLATAAALAGIETEGEEADRDDATGVVALAYAGLTATWPLERPSGLPSAPREGSGPPPPSRVAVGVPGDLDTICRETLGEGQGPDSPGDYAAQIAPWSRIPLAGAVRTSPRAGTDAPTEVVPTASGVAGDGSTSDDHDVVSGADGTGERDGSSGLGVAGAAGAAAGAAGLAGAAARSGSSDDAATTRSHAAQAGETPFDSGDDDATREIRLRHRDGVTAHVTRGDETPAGRRADDERTRRVRRPQDDSDDEHGRRGAAAAAAAAAAGAVGTGGKVIGDRLGKVARTAGDRSKEALHDARARREAIRADQRSRSSLGSAPTTAEIEAPAPLLPAEAGAPPSRRQANLVLGLMAGLVALACLFGTIGTSRIGSATDLGRILGGDETTAVATSQSASPSGSGSGSGSGGGEPLAIANAAGYDPAPGDGVEHNAEVPRVYDGDPDTIWTTEGYEDPSFGGVKQGVGVTVDLGQAQDISSVTLQLPLAAQATVYAGDQPTNSGTEIGRTDGRTGEVELTPSGQVTGRYVTVWFTTLSQGDDGRYRAAVGEITVR
ncbi:hypothetical protein DUHN55_09750 [Helicobacter pylori]